MHTRYLESIKSFEGFTHEAKWDHAQHSNGFGTKALYAGERISHAEADRRFAEEIEQARQFVERHATGWDEGTKAALTSLTFNAGTRWATSGLGDAVRNFDIDAVRTRFLAYTKASGEVLPGLVKRRLAEVSWIGEQQSAPAASSGGSMPASNVPAGPDPKETHEIPAAGRSARGELAIAPLLDDKAAAALPNSLWLLLMLGVTHVEMADEQEHPPAFLEPRSFDG